MARTTAPNPERKPPSPPAPALSSLFAGWGERVKLVVVGVGGTVPVAVPIGGVRGRRRGGGEGVVLVIARTRTGRVGVGIVGLVIIARTRRAIVSLRGSLLLLLLRITPVAVGLLRFIRVGVGIWGRGLRKSRGKRVRVGVGI